MTGKADYDRIVGRACFQRGECRANPGARCILVNKERRCAAERIGKERLQRDCIAPGTAEAS